MTPTRTAGGRTLRAVYYVSMCDGKWVVVTGGRPARPSDGGMTIYEARREAKRRNEAMQARLACR